MVLLHTISDKLPHTYIIDDLIFQELERIILIPMIGSVFSLSLVTVSSR